MNEPKLQSEREQQAREAYATDAQLAVRYRIHEEYSDPKIDFTDWVLTTHPWRGDEWVLDVGAGPGGYLDGILARIPDGHYVGGDLSLGMMRKARQHSRAGDANLLTFDAQAIPFASGAFDVVLANHMLYHVADISAALAEIRRVLKPSGVLVAATNGADTMPQLDTLSRRACTLLGHPRQDFKPGHVPFSLENGATQLARHFQAVVRYDMPSALRFPEVGPVLEYVNSLRAMRAPQLPDDVTWEEFMDVMEKQVERLIRHFGELQVHKLAGVLIATNGGGFAADYLTMLNEAGAAT